MGEDIDPFKVLELPEAEDVSAATIDKVPAQLAVSYFMHCCAR